MGTEVQYPPRSMSSEQGTVVRVQLTFQTERQAERGRLFTPRSDLNPDGAELQQTHSVV